MNDQTITCPAEGCDYTGPKSSVLGHYSGKRDDDHPGGYERAKTLLDDDVETAETPTETTTETTSNSDPTMGNANPDEYDEADESDDVELPCGHESFDPEDVEKSPPYIVSCDTCGESWRYENE